MSDEKKMTGTVVAKNGKRLLCQNSDGHLFITIGKGESGDKIEVGAEKIWPMPSVMFGMACLAEDNIDKAVEDMYMNHPRKWDW